MTESYAQILAVGGKSNSLGRTGEVIALVLQEKNRLDELYRCVFDEDAWVRMRAIDAVEKIGRQKPDWLVPYIDKFQSELASSGQPSIQWHLAQIYSQIPLAPEQKRRAINWLKQILSTSDVDWIVAANCMKTLTQFVHDGSVAAEDAVALFKIQQDHKSNTVIKTAGKLIAGLSLSA